MGSIVDFATSTFVCAGATSSDEPEKSITTYSQKVNAGKPSDLTASSRAMVSLSVLLWETAVCLFEKAVMGTKVLGPTIAMNIPLVLLESFTSSAKEASTYCSTWQSSAQRLNGAKNRDRGSS